MELATFRGLERLIIQLGGITLAVFGLMLYKWGVSGKASMSVERAGIRFQLLNGTPGLFFALFGTVIMCLGLYRPLTFPEEGKVGQYSGNDKICELLADVANAESEVASLDDGSLRLEIKSLAERANKLRGECKGE